MVKSFHYLAYKKEKAVMLVGITVYLCKQINRINLMLFYVFFTIFNVIHSKKQVE